MWDVQRVVKRPELWSRMRERDRVMRKGQRGGQEPNLVGFIDQTEDLVFHSKWHEKPFAEAGLG